MGATSPSLLNHERSFVLRLTTKEVDLEYVGESGRVRACQRKKGVDIKQVYAMKQGAEDEGVE